MSQAPDELVRHVYLVRHGRPRIDHNVPASGWDLDGSAHGEVIALRESGKLPAEALWFTSPEPKARQTAALLTDRPVEVVDGLAEQLRLNSGEIEDVSAVRRRAFAHPERSVHPGWEPLNATRVRVRRAVRDLLDDHPVEDVVLVGHGTAFALVASELTGGAPDPSWPDALAMPDVVVVRMRRHPPTTPPPIRDIVVMTLLITAIELGVWKIGARLGIVSLVVAGLGAVAWLPRRTRRIGWALLSAAVVALLVAAMVVVAAEPRTGA
jgi:broad specificity phosphatase PhoE